MLQELSKYLPKALQRSRLPETDAAPAYNIWSANYDDQPGNLMLDLDEIVLRRLLSSVDLKGKRIADIGCGTGRHWQKMLQNNPAHITGFDVSSGMLDRLIEKYPHADTELVTDDMLLNILTDSFDIAVSTLTVSYIKHLNNSLLNWCRIVKNCGDIIITDFHPQALDMGCQRTFRHEGRHIAIRNFAHQLAGIKAVIGLKNWEVVSEQQIVIDHTLKHYYENQNALHLYQKMEGVPIIYGLHFKQRL